MKKGIYRTLAWTGIKQNKKLYMPYILTCVGTVMMCYIVSFLSTSPVFRDIPGGVTMQSFLGMGFGVMSVFSVIFLFYTNSFLVRRRKKEFGLYNILGLGKGNLALVLLIETLIIAGMTIFGGLFFGILFSKLAELCMIKILGGAAAFTFTIMPISVVQTVVLFAGIFTLIYLNTLRQIHLTNPIQLLHSENAGEKPPKANWVIAIIGAVMLAWAYYLAVTIEDPVTAIMMFFVAVIMVVIATYLLFIAGSVALCKILQKNKSYYYKTNHFVSVSSMLYRMKRNGAGLASICILCTMVLVMVSSTVCLYTGTEDSIRNRYPRNISLDAVVSSVDFLNGEEVETTKNLVANAVSENKVELENVLEYRTASFGALLRDGDIIIDSSMYSTDLSVISDVWQVFIVPISDYNRITGSEESLEPGETLIYTTKEMSYDRDTIRIGDEVELAVAGKVGWFEPNGVDSMQIFPTMYLFVENIETITSKLEGYTYGDNGQSAVSYHWYYGFDLDCNDDTQIKIYNSIDEGLDELESKNNDFEYFHVITECVASERADFYGIYGGLFFLGILLGIAFILAAVLIIYYKQVSEGYEDQSRFDIMQKVGMTKKEIRKSINSQMLTVFFVPLITAGIHLAFAFPLIQKLLMLFSITNMKLLIAVTGCCYLVFALFYAVVYKATSHSYFSIVSGIRSENA